jgi:opacity protein-like surface antigen
MLDLTSHRRTIRLAACTASLACLLLGAAKAESGLYVRGGLGVDWSHETRFRDKDCAQTEPPALFGCQLGNDGRPIAARGDFGTPVALEAGIGYRLLPAFRTEALVSYRPDLDFSGRANFLNTPGAQPVYAEGDSLTGMLVGYLDIAALGVPSIGALEPFVGAGLGISRHHIESVDYHFPGLGAEASTITQGGAATTFSYLLTAGTALRLSERVRLDVSYRYSDLGEVETEAGPALITRSSGTFDLGIAGTKADLRTQGIAASFRFTF